MQAKIVLPWVLNKWDWIIFFAVLTITIGSIIYGHILRKKSLENSGKEESFLELLLMGRSLTLPMFVATLVATWYGGIFGVTAIAFKNGIYNFVTQGVFWYVTYIIFALFLVEKIKNYNSKTLAEMVGEMFGPKSQKLAAVFNFFNVIPIAYAISVGILIQLLFGMDFPKAVSVGVLFVTAYSMIGGLRSVVFSDLVQFFVMCSGVLIVLLFSVYEFGGLDYLTSNLPESYFHITGEHGWAATLVWGIIALSTLVDPNFYQRCLAAKSPQVAKKGILISTGIWMIFDLCTTFGAMYAFTQIPQANGNEAYMTYSVQLLPHGLKGFFIAGILATILSTLDSYLFIAATSLSYDLTPKKYRHVNYYPYFLVACAILAIILGLSFEGNIKQVWKTLGSYSSACLLLPVLYGHLFPKRITDNQFISTSLIAAISTSIWRNIDKQGFWSNVDELYAGCLTSLVLLIIFTLKNSARNRATQ